MSAGMTPAELGERDAYLHADAVETYNARPPDRCPFAKGTPEQREYDRGWRKAMADMDAEDAPDARRGDR